MTNSKYNAHTDPIFKFIKTLKVQDMYAQKCLNFFHKHFHHKLPKSFDNLFFISHTESSSRDTRSGYKFYLPFCRIELTKSVLKYKIPYKVNRTPKYIKDKVNEYSYKRFSSFTKFQFIKSYKKDCTIRHCYICGRN